MKKYFKKYLENRCSDGDFKSVIELFSEPTKQAVLEEQMAENWAELPEKGEAPDLTDTLYKIHFELNKQERIPTKSINLLTYITRIAAVLVLPLAIAFYFQIQKNAKTESIVQTISTPMASKTTFELPDGSKVWLNSGSKISFSKEFAGDIRKVTLEGEAYFDVKKDGKPFQVQTPLFAVNVLGTAFNVMAYDHEIPKVTLERGKVSLETKSKNKQILVPGQQAVIDTLKQTINLENVDTRLFSSWIYNQLIFKDEPLGDVVRRLERWYNIHIEIRDRSLLLIPMTANIEFESIREVMELMELTLPINYKYDKENRKLEIAKK